MMATRNVAWKAVAMGRMFFNSTVMDLIMTITTSSSPYNLSRRAINLYCYQKTTSKHDFS